MSKRSHPQSVTNLPSSAEDDRRARMIKYTVAMSIRTVCVVALVFVRDWWILVAAVGAIVLPYIAVVLANVGAKPAAVGAAPPESMLSISPVILPPEDERGASPRDR